MNIAAQGFEGVLFSLRMVIILKTAFREVNYGVKVAPLNSPVELNKSGFKNVNNSFTA